MRNPIGTPKSLSSRCSRGALAHSFLAGLAMLALALPVAAEDYPAGSSIDWQSWDSELFEESEARERPIFFYFHGQWCTWCRDFQDESLMAFSIILLGVLSWRFYGTAAPLIPPGRRQISPMAVFVVGLALLIGVTYNVFLWNLDFWDATPDFGLAAIHFAPIGFLFIHHYRDT